MGWSQGSEVMEAVIDSLIETGVNGETRRDIYHRLVPTLLDMDWDTVAEAMGRDKIFDKIIKEEFPDSIEAEASDDEDTDDEGDGRE